MTDAMMGVRITDNAVVTGGQLSAAARVLTMRRLSRGEVVAQSDAHKLLLIAETHAESIEDARAVLESVGIRVVE